MAASKGRVEGAVAMANVVMVNRGSAKRASRVNRANPVKAVAATVVTAKSEPSARSEQNVKRGRSNARNVLQRAGRAVVKTGGAHVLVSAAMRRAVRTMQRVSEGTMHS